MALAEGIRIHQCIDDWLMRAKTKQQCQENTHRLIHLVQSLGWIINFEKSDLIPTQEIEFWGYKFDLRVVELKGIFALFVLRSAFSVFDFHH